MRPKMRYKQNIPEFLSYFIIIGMMMILVFEPLEVTFFASFGVWLIFIAVILVFVVAVMEDRVCIDRITIATILFAIIGVFSIVVGNQISYKSLVTLISVLEIPLFVISVRKISFQKTVMFIYRSFFCISLFFIVLSFTSVAYRFTNEYGVSQVDFLTLGYGNPNKAGMILFGCVAVLLSYFNYVDGFEKKVLIALDMVYMLFLICQTESRVCIIISVLLLLYSLVKMRKNIKLFGWICYIISICFAPLLLLFPKWIMNINLLGDAFDTGRSLIYSNVLNSVGLKSFFIGNYTYQFSNLHNLYVSLFATVGVLGTVVFAIFYFSVNKKLSGAYENNAAKIAYLAICLYMLHSSVESAMFLNGSIYSAIIILLYILCMNRADADGTIRRNN